MKIIGIVDECLVHRFFNPRIQSVWYLY